jgi:D-sedoheptulose 7-phosphate isomerase
MDEQSRTTIAAATKWICRSILDGSTIFTCGNGGSAADAAHMTERKPLRSVCLNADAIAMSCIANDFGWQNVFARQVEALGRPGDVLVVFSTSGESRNVIMAVKRAVECGMYCIHVGGEEMGEVGRLSDIHIGVPSGQTERVQEVHTVILHHFVQCVEDMV